MGLAVAATHVGGDHGLEFRRTLWLGVGLRSDIESLAVVEVTAGWLHWGVVEAVAVRVVGFAH